MTLLKRRAVLGAVATSALWSPALWAKPAALKMSHQFPAGGIDAGDFRDRLCRLFAAEASRRAGELSFSIHPGAALMRPAQQFNAMRRGTLDFALMPLSYGGVDVPEAHIGMLPGVVSSYDQAYAWKNAEIGRELQRVMFERGIVIVSWVWQACSLISRGRAVLDPYDAKGMKVRGGSREMDLLLAAAGADIVAMPSNEIYQGMKSGAIDAAITSSTSLTSFRLEEVAKVLVTGRGNSFCYSFAPLMMSRMVYERLRPGQQAALMAAGEKMEAFARMQIGLDDSVLGRAFHRVGAEVVELTAPAIKRWTTLARSTSWQDFGVKSLDCNKLLRLAEKSL